MFIISMDSETLGMFCIQAKCLQFQPLPKLLSVFQTQVRKNFSLSVWFSFCLIMRFNSQTACIKLLTHEPTYSEHYHQTIINHTIISVTAVSWRAGSPSQCSWLELLNQWTQSYTGTKTASLLLKMCFKISFLSSLTSQRDQTGFNGRYFEWGDWIRTWCGPSWFPQFRRWLIHWLTCSGSSRLFWGPLILVKTCFQWCKVNWVTLFSSCHPAHLIKQQLLVYKLPVL